MWSSLFSIYFDLKAEWAKFQRHSAQHDFKADNKDGYRQRNVRQFLQSA